MKPGKIIIIYSFIICLFLLIAGILSARSTAQLLNSLIYLPLIFYFGTKIIQMYQKRLVIKVKPKSVPEKKVEKQTVDLASVQPEIIPGVSDNDKRLFLKLIGSAGASLLFMALFTKKAQASFFGSAPVGPGTVAIKDSTGNKIDPAEKKPTDGYEISNIDDSGVPAYYGFIKKGGAWYILRNNSGTFLYAKGDNDYTIYWNTRGTLTFDLYNNVFG